MNLCNHIIFHRKQELRELKMLQKQEQKQFQDLAFKAHIAKEQQVYIEITILMLLIILYLYSCFCKNLLVINLIITLIYLIVG